MRAVRGRGTGALRWLAMIALLACQRDNKAATPPHARSASDSDSAAAPSAAGDDRQTILFLGTSLTAGLGLPSDSAYPQQIQRRIDAAKLPWQTVNAGVSGETAAGLLRRLEWVLQRPAQIIVVETGANDGLRGQAVAATRVTIDAIVDRIRRDRPEARVLLVQMEAPTNMGRAYTSAFHEIYPAVAKEKGVTLLPFLLDGVAGRPALNQQDGVHPNYVGERIVTENMWKGLEPLLRAPVPAPGARNNGHPIARPGRIA